MMMINGKEYVPDNAVLEQEVEPIVPSLDAEEKEMFDLYSELFLLWSKKNRDYGDSFHTTFERFGMISAIVRMADKMGRLVNLLDGEEANFEGVDDTLIDLANYAIMTLRELRKVRMPL